MPLATGLEGLRAAVRGAGRPGDRALRAMVGIGTAILIMAALAIARPIFAPLAFALFVIAIVWPLQARLQRWLPQLVALALTILATIVVVAAFGWSITWGLSRAGRYVVANAAKFQVIYDGVADWLGGHGIAVASLWAEHFNVGWILVAVQEITSRINGTLSFTIVILIYVILGLLEVGDAAKRLRSPSLGGSGDSLLVASALTAAKLRRYMLVRTLMSVITGILVWAFISLCGLPLGLEWGVIAFALNYIPFIGPLVATVLPTVFAVTEFDTWQSAILVFGSLNLIQFLVGSYLEPRIAGSVLSMSPFMVLFAVFFWTYLWGIAGAFIGVPIVIAILTICEQYDSSRWAVSIFGAAGGGPDA
jgi:AI-2 transport protein TqsA